MTNRVEFIKTKMIQIRAELDEIAIRRGDLVHEYRMLNQELGRIELEVMLEKTKEKMT